MTNSISSETQAKNLGAFQVVEAKVDITSLESAGTESWDPASQLAALNSYDRVIVLEQEEYRRRFAFEEDNDQFRVTDRGPVQNQKSVDPDNQTYNDDTTIATYDAGPDGSLQPVNFNPDNPSGADLSIILRAEYHDGTTTDLVTVSDGSEKTLENLVDGVATGDDGKAIRKLLVVVNDSGSGTTENLGATTTEFIGYNQQAANNDDVGTVTVRVEARR